METKISVLLADPGEQYRAAYSKAIGQETDMELVAQTDNGLRAEELITKFQPDVVVLDLVLVGAAGLGVVGAAYATVAAQGAAGTVAFAVAWRRYPAARLAVRQGDFDESEAEGTGEAVSGWDSDRPLPWRASARTVWRACRGAAACMGAVLRVGVPSAVQMAVVNLSYALVTGLLNRYGTDVAAAAGVGLQISTLAGLPCWAVGQAITTGGPRRTLAPANGRVPARSCAWRAVQRGRDHGRADSHPVAGAGRGGGVRPCAGRWRRTAWPCCTCASRAA